MLFTDNVIEHILDFLAVPFLMGVLNFPATQDCWHRDVGCIGTVRQNRIVGAILMSDKVLRRVVAVKCYGNKCVNHLSLRDHASFKCPTVEQRGPPCLSLISAYRNGMDWSDMLVHLYKTPAKSRRWYIPLFFTDESKWKHWEYSVYNILVLCDVYL